MKVFQVDAKLVTAANSQAVNLVQSEPKLAVQITKAVFVVSPAAEEIYRPSRLFWNTVQPPPAVLWSQNTSNAPKPSGSILYTPLICLPNL